MPRYSFYVSERYDDDEAPAKLHRITGAPIGLATHEWPRQHGRPMQHAFTIDLAELELELPRAAGARALSVFVDSYYELDVGSSEGIRVVWLSQAQIDAHPQTLAPADFVAEQRPGHETMDEEGGYYENGELGLEVAAIEEDEGEREGNFGESYLGGSPAWADAGAPARLPEGAFVMQVMSYEFPVCRRPSCLFVFEGGAYLQAEDPDDEYLPMPWPEAIAATRELVVLDRAPAAGALQKWGGMPRGVSSDAWPNRMSHILTWVPDPAQTPEDRDAVALALFGRLSKTDNWDVGEATFYELREISQRDLDELDGTQVELPAGAELLPERTLELRELPEGTTWRDLQTRCFIGPRPAWPRPDHRSAEQDSEGMVVQLSEAALPVSPGRGSLILLGPGYPIWHPSPGAPQAASSRYEPQGTLYASDTTAAIVVGWELGFTSFSVPAESIEALEQTLLAALATRDPDHGLTLYVPGDTTTDRNREIHGSVVLGRAVVEVEANDYEPGAVDRTRLANALADLPKLDDSFWREALAFVSSIEAPEAGPCIYLLSWGPLCYGSLLVGVAANKETAHAYRFIANQDMHQDWSSVGVDGVSVDSVEFSSVLELEAEALASSQLAKVDKHAAPGFWLLCRYD